MIDQIEQLEKRVETLISLLEDARLANLQLSDENQLLKQQLEEKQGVESSNEQLQTQINQLEGEIEGMANKEGQIRDRLCKILGKIDSIEKEISASGPAASGGE